MNATKNITAETIERLTRRLTAANSMSELCETRGYVPTVRVTGMAGFRKSDLVAFADAYDDHQILMGDTRRAFRC